MKASPVRGAICTTFLSIILLSVVGLGFGQQRSGASGPGFDRYGGWKGLATKSTGFFRIEKIGDRWWLITPDGHGFFTIGISMVFPGSAGSDETGRGYADYVAEKYAIGQGPKDGFLQWQDRWGYYARERLRSWGFNTIATFSHYPAVIGFGRSEPIIPPFGSRPPNLMPQVITKRSGGYAMRDGGVKNLYGPIFSLAGGGLFPDVFDPAFERYVNEDAKGESWRESPWVVFVFLDQTDEMRGTVEGHPHLGFIAAATAPTLSVDPRAFGGPRSYIDPRMYTKEALRDFLRAKYMTLAALNRAWGTTYTSWESAGGWGRGTGLLDEDGRNLGTWRSPDPAKEGRPAVRRDLDAFAARIIRQWYRTVSEAYRRHKPNHILATNNMPVPPKPYVYEGLLSEDGTIVYVDLIYAGNDPQAGIWADRLGRPFLGKTGGTAENDSPLGYHGVVQRVEFDDREKRVVVTASGVDFFWAGHPRFKTLGYVLTQFSSLPPVLKKGNQETLQFYRSARADWLGRNQFAVRSYGYASGTYEELKAVIKPGDHFKRVIVFSGQPLPAQFDTQEARGRRYATDMAELVTRRSPAGSRFVVGAHYWAWPDTGWIGYFEAYNFGLVSLRDNAYDGIEATTAVATDRFGFSTRSERRDYGDFLSAVRAANLAVYGK